MFLEIHALTVKLYREDTIPWLPSFHCLVPYTQFPASIIYLRPKSSHPCFFIFTFLPKSTGLPLKDNLKNSLVSITGNFSKMPHYLKGAWTHWHNNLGKICNEMSVSYPKVSELSQTSDIFPGFKILVCICVHAHSHTHTLSTLYMWTQRSIDGIFPAYIDTNPGYNFAF